MAPGKDILLARLRSGDALSGIERLRLTFLLALPAILAQLSMCLLSYIDSAMVGRLGSAQAAAVGLVSTTTWIFGSFCYANSSGFTVQIAHRCGAGDRAGARRVFLQGLGTTLAVSAGFAALGIAISSRLPVWLGGGPDIIADASDYFRIYSLFLPSFQLAVYCESALIASGNIKIPSITSIAMCVADAAFNYIFIFLCGWGVRGAAVGTALATLLAGLFLLFYLRRFSNELGRRASGEVDHQSRSSSKQVLSKALGIAWPLWIQNLAVRCLHSRNRHNRPSGDHCHSRQLICNHRRRILLSARIRDAGCGNHSRWTKPRRRAQGPCQTLCRYHHTQWLVDDVCPRCSDVDLYTPAYGYAHTRCRGSKPRCPLPQNRSLGRVLLRSRDSCQRMLRRCR